MPIDDPRNRLASRRWTWRARRARRDVRASVPLVGFCVWPRVASRRTSSVGFGIPSSRERSSQSSRRRRRRVRRRRFPPSGTGTVPIGERRRDGRVPSGSPRRGWKAGASPGNRARVAGRVVAAKATATATANGTDLDGLRTSTDGTPPRGVPVPRAGTGTGMDLRPRRTPPQTRRRRIRRFGRRERGRGGPAGRVPRSRRARARRRTRAGLVAAPRRGRRCGAGGRRARAGAGAGGRETPRGARRRHRRGGRRRTPPRRSRSPRETTTSCRHAVQSHATTPNARWRRRSRAGWSVATPRAKPAMLAVRAKPRVSRARVGVCVARGEDASRRGCRNVVVLTGERANGRYFFYRSSPRAPTYAHLDAKVMRVLRYDSPPRHLCRPGIVTRRRPRTRVGRPARRGTRFETTRDSRTPPRTPARSPARISTPPASPPPRRRGRRPSSDSPRPT